MPNNPPFIAASRDASGRPVLHYGADFNPEQWPTSTLDEDIELMREAGVTMVSLGIFSWAHLEPADGAFDFAWFDGVIERLHAAGITIDLATATASPPAWLSKAHPETLPVDRSGRRLGIGSRQQFCPSSPVFRKYSARLAGALAERYGNHPAVRLWHISNEYGCHVSQCYCEVSSQAFRAWLRERYETIDALNDAWGTSFWSQRYTSFGQIDPPAAMPTFPNPGQVADFMSFSSDELLQCYLAEKAAIREHSSAPVTTNFMGLFPPINYRKWAAHVDVVADDSYPEPSAGAARETAFVSDLMRSLKDGQPFFLLEQTTAAVQWRERNSRKRPGVFALQSLQRVAHGADSIMQFQWRQSVRGAETFHSSMVPHAGRESKTWGEVVELGRALASLSGLVGARVETKVALLIDWESQWHREAAIGPGPNRSGEAIRAWHATAFERGYTVDFVFPDSDLSGYGVIIVPEVFAIGNDLAGRLIAAASAGTQVIVTAPTGVVDETGRANLGGYARVLEPLLGVRVVDHQLPSGNMLHDVDPRVDSITAAINVVVDAETVELEVEPASPLWRALERIATPRPALRGEYWAEDIRVEDADVLARFIGLDLDGSPAITYRKVNDGGGTYVGTDLDAAGRAAVFRLAEARARIGSGRTEVPAGVECVRRGDVTFLLNHSDRAAEIAGQVGVDLISGQPATGRILLPPRSAAAIQTS